MSNDTGLVVERNDDRKKWQVLALNMSSDHTSLISEHEKRSDAIEAAIDQNDNDYYEYGIVSIQKEKPNEV